MRFFSCRDTTSADPANTSRYRSGLHTIQVQMFYICIVHCYLGFSVLLCTYGVREYGFNAGEEGAVRLVDRLDVNAFATGTLQVFWEGAWGAVCTSNFNDQDAAVACRQLSFRSGVRLPNERILTRFIPQQVHPSGQCVQNHVAQS